MGPRHMYYDELAAAYKRDSIVPPQIMRELLTDLEKRMRISNVQEMNAILPQSHVFYLNAGVVESLAEIPLEETNIEGLLHKPFPVMFFELSEPLQFNRTDKLAGDVRGFLVGGGIETCVTTRICQAMLGDKVDVTKELGLDERFNAITIFYAQTHEFDQMHFSTKDLIEFHTGTAKVSTSPMGQYDESKMGVIVKESYRQMMALACNLVNYCNAHNATIRVEERGLPLASRLKNPKKRKIQGLDVRLKPIHWIEIKKSTHEISGARSASDVELAYRELVRGHFQSYHSKEGTRQLWKVPYIRGPEGAPWKNNRYELVAKMLEKGEFPK